MAVTQVLSLFIKHRRRSRAEQGGKAAVSVQKTPFAGFFRRSAVFFAKARRGNAA
jgi:hypothetical protein